MLKIEMSQVVVQAVCQLDVIPDANDPRVLEWSNKFDEQTLHEHYYLARTALGCELN